ncbi:hypothetical protein BCV70DRAFT_26241 [Testicularia cyperi]|uniref:DinB-like domain-containing protein n=1 Tax=Testicularia cyperi TaxID=1882483 RepID=A0A317XLM5_9BASI|nr:hypothetical protein BCV70DRAFT_26241 [Testicularia cyperi]
MSSKEAEDSILACTAQIMDQAVRILRSSSITSETFQFESQVMPNSTPGKHLRHVLDHFRILLDAIESWTHRSLLRGDQTSSSRSISTEFVTQSSSSMPPRAPADVLVVDYDTRVMSRIPELETSPEVSLHEFEATVDRLFRVFGSSQGRLFTHPIRLRATTPFLVEMDSTIGRELWFCSLHAIHHYALARVILVRELGLTVDPKFGVAPSTLVHRQWRKESSLIGAGHDQDSQQARARL